jgi:hypothetical protein
VDLIAIHNIKSSGIDRRWRIDHVSHECVIDHSKHLL